MNEIPHMFLRDQKVVIVGAGLVGTLGAIMLAQRGARVELIERQALDKARAFSNHRSFNVTISSRGRAALEAAGIWRRIERQTIPITGRMCHMGLSETSFPYSPDRHLMLHGARRSDVNAELLAAASEIEGISIRFGWALVDLDKATGSVTVAPVSGNAPAETIGDADFVIGVDGVNSAVRRMIHRDEAADFAQRYLEWNYRELAIPASPDSDRPWPMDPNSLHIWPRGDLMMFALPNPDGTFTGNFIYPADKDDDFGVPGRIDELLRREFPDVVGLVQDAEDRLRTTPPSYFQTQRNSKWFHKDKFVLVGDAAHATVPFYGQGMNSGFESMVELLTCLERFGSSDRAKAFATYQQNRKRHTDAVADLSIANFDELRANFQHVLPQARRRVDVLLYKLFPRAYVPLHIKISHSLTAYQTAIDECARRDRVLRYFGFDLLVSAFAGFRLVEMSVGRIRGSASRMAARLAAGTKRHLRPGNGDAIGHFARQASSALNIPTDAASGAESMIEERHTAGAAPAGGFLTRDFP